MAKVTLQNMNDRQNAYMKTNREKIKENITNVANAAARVVTLEGKASSQGTKITSLEGKVTSAETTLNQLKSNSIAVPHLTPSGSTTIDAQLKALIASPVQDQNAWVDISAAKDGTAWDLYVYDGTNWVDAGASSTHQVAAYNDAPLVARVVALEGAVSLDDTALAAAEAVTF